MKRSRFLLAASQICLLVCLCHASYADQSAWVEDELRGWQPGSEHAQLPAKAIRRAIKDITGEWIARHSGHCCTWLNIWRTRQGSYYVEFKTLGCVGDWDLIRTGEYADGVLTLNRPVIEYVDRTYQRLHAVRIVDEQYLLPSVAVETVQEAISEDGSQVLDPGVLHWHLFSRRTPKKPPTSRTLRSRVTILILVAVGAGAGLTLSILLLERTTGKSE